MKAHLISKNAEIISYMLKLSKIIIKSVAALAVAVSLCDCSGLQKPQVKWPLVTQEMKPWSRWWWFGSAVNEKDLSTALEAYQKVGLGGVEITPIYGVRGTENHFIEYLSSEWVDKFIYTLGEAERLGVGVDLANASGWPFGGPWIDESAASRNMVSKVYLLQGGQILADTISYIQQPLVRMQSNKKVEVEEVKYPLEANQPRQEYAFDQVRYKKELPLLTVTANRISENGITEVVDVTDKVVGGKLAWTAPEGEWIICALFQGDHGKMVERSGPGGEGLVIDHFSEEALEIYLNKFDEAFKGRDLSYLRYYFNDSYEVDDALGESNWTPGFFTEFQKLQGYDLKKYLPALLGLDTDDMNGRVLYDYRMTISQLLLDKYTRSWQQWAAGQGKGIRNQAHGSPANVLDLYAASDVPEIEGNDIVNLKSAPSAAHVTGKKLVSSETCTWLSEHFESSLGKVKADIDKYLLAGVNHIFYHGTAYSPQNAAWPGWLFYAAVHFTPANSFWEDFGAVNQYVARAQSFLQAGKPSNDILLYFSIADLWSVPGKKGMLSHFHSGNLFNALSMKECGNFFTRNGYSWDAISDKQLLDVTYRKNSLCTGGNNYQTIVVPETQLVPVETFEKLMHLAKEGATILFHKLLPVDVPGLSGVEASRKLLDSLKAQLLFTEEGNVRIATYGKGKIILSDDLSALVGSAHVRPETLVASGLQCIRRIKDNGDFYYFIKNPAKEAFEGWIALNADYCAAALYNPMTEMAGYAKVRENSGKNEIYVQMKPGESLIVETFKREANGELYPYYKENGKPVPLTDSWIVAFVKGGPELPASNTIHQLESWTNYGPEYEIFSGTAEYITQIPALSVQADAWRLNVEEVHESASVYIDSTYIGTLLDAPYSIEIPANLLQDGSELKIRVSNLMANRIADLDKRGIEWRKFYNTNFNAKQKNNVGKDGKFSAEHWKPKDSGLCGTVTLTPLCVVR